LDDLQCLNFSEFALPKATILHFSRIISSKNLMRTRVFQSGNSQAVRIPKEFQFERVDIDYEIERCEEGLLIRPLPPTLEGALEKFAAFTPDFLADGRPDQGEQERDTF
jgi:antitoxin VapB